MRLLSLRGLKGLSPLAALACLCACAQPAGLLVTSNAPAGVGTKVDLLVTTTRAHSDQPDEVFSGERGEGLAFADVVISIPPNRPIGSIQWPRNGVGDPLREFTVTSLTNLNRNQVLPWYKKSARGRRRVLIFVHGFNTRFDAAVFRFAQFVNDSNANLVPVLFSWPSRGRLLDYNYDRESTNYSRSDLAYVLDTAAHSPDVDEVVLMAHSMGAWLTVEALRQLAFQEGHVPTKISNVILASPDIDTDVFEKQVADMGPKRPHFTVFVSRNDHALGLSRLISGQVTRLGAVDLTNDENRARLESASGVVVLDLTKLQSSDTLNHSKFATSPDIVQLLGDRLLEGQVIDESDIDGSDTLQAVGTAVRTVVSAPIMVFNSGRN